MRVAWLLPAVAILAFAGCGERVEEKAAPPREKGEPGRITHFIGMFRHYDPPWVDHSRWMKDD